MIFPDFENIDIIDLIRKQYDPLAEFVRPHITIVFPFDSELSNEELEHILDVRLKDMEPFHLELRGFSKHSDRFGNYLFLNLTRGSEIVEKIHDELYSNEFKMYCSDFDYVPHMTVGKLASVSEMDEAYDKIKNRKDTFVTTVDKISVEMIGSNDESIISIEKWIRQGKV